MLFCKQKTAYELRISDWSSDVCSSDLDYEGFELDGQYGLTTRGDAANYRFRALAGYNFGDGRGNVTISAEYNKGEGLTGVDRPAFASGLFFRDRSEEHTSELQSLMRISYAVFCLKKKQQQYRPKHKLQHITKA